MLRVRLKDQRLELEVLIRDNFRVRPKVRLRIVRVRPIVRAGFRVHLGLGPNFG